MNRLVYTKAAVEDLQRLRAFMAEHDPHSAARVAAELVRRIQKLREFPRMGRPVTEAPDPEMVRDMVFGRYVVRYALPEEDAVREELVVILRV